jgi:hypothetical protein
LVGEDHGLAVDDQVGGARRGGFKPATLGKGSPTGRVFDDGGVLRW